MLNGYSVLRLMFYSILKQCVFFSAVSIPLQKITKYVALRHLKMSVFPRMMI